MLMRHGDSWGLILAGGEGTRLTGFVRQLYGIARPKQYCAIVGRRSMLQHTRDRIELLYPRDRILTVVNHSHLDYVREQLADQPSSTILTQPCGRETANGILLGLLHIYTRDKEATVSIFPADHFVREEARLMLQVDLASRCIRKQSDAIILLGATPDDGEQEYGWIEKDRPVKNPWKPNVHHIRRFWEKPDRAMVEKLFESKCLWSTLIMVGRVRTFLSLFQRLAPENFLQLSEIMRFPKGEDQDRSLEKIYPLLSAFDFSRAILEQSPDQFCVQELSDIYWSDWGNEVRVLKDIERFDLRLNKSSTGRNLLPTIPADHFMGSAHW